MADQAEAAETVVPADDTNADRWLIVAFVVCILLGLGVLGWHYHSSDKTAPLCASPDARCGEKTDPGAQ